MLAAERCMRIARPCRCWPRTSGPGISNPVLTPPPNSGLTFRVFGRATGCFGDERRYQNLVFVVVPTTHKPCYGGEEPTSHLPAQDFDSGILCRVRSETTRYLVPNQALIVVSTVLSGTCRSLLAPLVPLAKYLWQTSSTALHSSRWGRCRRISKIRTLSSSAPNAA